MTADAYMHLMQSLTKIYTDQQIVEFMDAPNKLLNGDIAIDLIEQGRIAEVQAVVDQLVDGVHI